MKIASLDYEIAQRGEGVGHSVVHQRRRNWNAPGGALRRASALSVSRTINDLNELILQITRDGTTFVMEIENVDAWADSRHGVRVLRALKSGRDAANLSLDRTGSFVAVGIGGSSQMIELTQERNHAFYVRCF